jgi:hypothetical protein
MLAPITIAFSPRRTLRPSEGVVAADIALHLRIFSKQDARDSIPVHKAPLSLFRDDGRYKVERTPEEIARRFTVSNTAPVGTVKPRAQTQAMQRANNFIRRPKSGRSWLPPGAERRACGVQDWPRP